MRVFLPGFNHREDLVLKVQTLFLDLFEVIIIHGLDSLFGTYNGFINIFVFLGKVTKMRIADFQGMYLIPVLGEFVDEWMVYWLCHITGKCHSLNS